MNRQFDLLVVGGGPAGYSAAIHASRKTRSQGARIGLIEPGPLGGTCLNRGCIPTKTLIETARYLDWFGEAAVRGIDISGTPTVDLAKAFQYKDRIVKRMSAGIGVLLREQGVIRIEGKAQVRRGADPDRPFSVTISGNAGETEELTSKKIVLATGSTPARFAIPGMDDPAAADRILDSDDILDSGSSFQQIPERLAILGGGVIGIEMARIFKAFGSEVHLIEALPRLAPMLDVEVSAALAKSLSAKKIKSSVGRKLERIDRAETGLSLHLDNGERIAASHLLVAVGRAPNTTSLSEELRAESRPNAKGFIPVDAEMKTAVAGLFAPGDVNGKCMLAHAALEMGRLAADAVAEELFPTRKEVEEISESALEEYRRRIMEKEDDPLLPDRTSDFFPFYVPGCIYGEPEIGFLGWTEEEAKVKAGDKIRVGRFPFAANGRAASSGHREGFVKVIALEDDPRPVGVHIVGPCASELINEASVVLSLGGNLEQWATSIHAHPTYGEALAEAAADTLHLALHLPPK